QDVECEGAGFLDLLRIVVKIRLILCVGWLFPDASSERYNPLLTTEPMPRTLSTLSHHVRTNVPEYPEPHRRCQVLRDGPADALAGRGDLPSLRIPPGHETGAGRDPAGAAEVRMQRVSQTLR